MLRAALAGGAITEADRDATRARWLAEQRALIAPRFHGYLGVHADAVQVETPDDATKALAALADFGAVPPAFLPLTLAEGGIGNTYRLAGRIDDALAWLDPAVLACRALDHPVEYVRAVLHRGMALEAKGDTTGACAAYAIVVDRWGAAKPRSVTADEARARAKKLGCAAPAK
jgi:serine/threonine-protein kinase